MSKFYTRNVGDAIYLLRYKKPVIDGHCFIAIKCLTTGDTMSVHCVYTFDDLEPFSYEEAMLEML